MNEHDRIKEKGNLNLKFKKKEFFSPFDLNRNQNHTLFVYLKKF